MRATPPRRHDPVLGLVLDALMHVGPGFPDRHLTAGLRELLNADFAGAGRVDLRGTASQRWSDAPEPIRMAPRAFHEVAVSHPLTREHRRPGGFTALRLSDVSRPRTIQLVSEPSGMPHLVTLPLAVTPDEITAIAVMKAATDFTLADLELARELQPVLAAIHPLGRRTYTTGPRPLDRDLGITLTARELAVLNLMSHGLIAIAIGRELRISPRTVNKHIESIYRKLDVHDRTSAVLRAQAGSMLGGAQPHRVREAGPSDAR